MIYWILNYIIIIVAAILLATLIIPKILLIAFRCNLYDAVDDRKVHRGVVPRLGGISFLPSIGVALCLTIGVNMRLSAPVAYLMTSAETVQFLFLGASLLMIYLLGITDDLIGVRYRAKFLFQIAGGVMIVVSGLWVDDLFGFLWIDSLAEWLGWFLTIFFVVYVLNAINFIDGIDGLASGLSLVAFAWYSYLFYMAGDYVPMLLSGAALGTLIPFFYYNVFGKASTHNKIFMGDTGSLTIGLLLSFLSIKVADLSNKGFEAEFNLFVLAIAPIIIPCFDVVRVFIHRLRRGDSPFLPDKSHIHHKLLALGFGQRKSLVLILLADAALIALNFWAARHVGATLIIGADVAIWTIANLYLTSRIRRREKEIGETLYR